MLGSKPQVRNDGFGARKASMRLKFLFLKFNHIGDALLMTPALHFVRKKFPDARIDVVVRRGGEQVLEENPDIDHLYVSSAPKGEDANKNFWSLLPKLIFRRYDYAFDLSNSDRSRAWMLFSMSKKFCANNAYGELGKYKWIYDKISTFQWGKEHQALKDLHTVSDALDIKPEREPLVINADISEEFLFTKLPFLKNLQSNYAVIHPTSRWAFKQWLPQRWAEVADRLKNDHHMEVIFSCGPDEKEIDHINQILAVAQEKHLTTQGMITLRELAWLLKKAKLFCGVDTVAMHIAAAMQTPSVALFGPSSEWSWHPWQCRHELVLGNCSCKQTRKFICDKSRPYPCMEGISVENVMEKIGKFL